MYFYVHSGFSPFFALLQLRSSRCTKYFFQCDFDDLGSHFLLVHAGASKNQNFKARQGVHKKLQRRIWCYM